jgi:3-oxosteroid 1-dehydrogenase
MSTEFDEVTDIIVVGSGSGALTGAYTAASRGEKVTILESTDKFGGTSAYAGSGIWLPGNQAQERGNVGDSAEKGMVYMKYVIDGYRPEMTETYINTSAPMIADLEKNSMMDFEYRPFPDYYHEAPEYKPMGRAIFPLDLPGETAGKWVDVLRPPLATDRLGSERPKDLTGGQSLLARLMLAIEATGNAELRLETPMTELIVENGNVVGVIAEHEGQVIRMRARKGVLMAAGGFGQNSEMRIRYGNRGRAHTSTDSPGGLGRPIEAGIEIGAAVDLMDQAWWSPGAVAPDGSSSFTLGFAGGIFVDSEGNRFANESLPYDRMGREILKCKTINAPDEYFWFVFDGRFGDSPAAGPSVPVTDFQSYYDAGVWKRADTLEDLAEQIGVPAGNLTATVERFNGFAASGVDEDFHRGESGYDKFFAQGDGHNPNLVPIERGPFQAMAYNISDLGTKGGLLTDTSARVLREDGTIIPGIYAAGNTMASMSGQTYPGPGVPIGSSMVFSYLAVLDMIEKAS